MKKIIISIVVLMAAAAANGATPTDTIRVSHKDVTRIVSDTTTTAKGKQKVTQYLIINGGLYRITKSHCEQLRLHIRHGLTPKLAIIPSKKKAIVL